MKIKQSFVTNSSTACFIVIGDNNITKSLKEYCDDNRKGHYFYPEFILFKSIGQLNYYVNHGNAINEKFSWIDEMMGVEKFFYMDEYNYKICKEHIKQKKHVLMVRIDKNADVDDLFDFIENKNHRIIIMDDL